jgi:formylglycine-generating enzyme required for sulfatase activity
LKTDFTAIVLCDVDRIVAVSGTATATEVKITMKPVTGGVFYMGVQCDEPAKPNYESGNLLCNVLELYPGINTVHKVALNSFYMSKTEITQKQFKTVMGIENTDPAWNSTIGIGDDYPAYNVSWYDAIAFCNKLSILEGRDICYTVEGLTSKADWESLTYNAIPKESSSKWDAAVPDRNANGYRLPTEAEWEYAARGGQKNKYTRTLGTSGNYCLYSGNNDINDIGKVAWYNKNNSPTFGAKPVATKLPNELGLYDMSGNIFEWCWDWYGAYHDCCVNNPDDPEGKYSYLGPIRVNRGGHYGSAESYYRVSYRSSYTPYTRNTNIGFRVAASE